METEEKKQIIWHSAVHTAFGEVLQFYFISTHSIYPQGILNDVTFRTKQITGIDLAQDVCFYHTLGSVDFMYRMWTPSSEVPLYSKELVANLRDTTILRSQVFQSDIAWERNIKLEKVDTDFLFKKETLQLIEILQANSNVKLNASQTKIYNKLKKLKYLKEQTSNKDRLKCYICIYNPINDLSNDSVDIIVEDAKEKLLNNISADDADISIYRTTGYSNILVRVSFLPEEFKTFSSNVLIFARSCQKSRCKTNTLFCVQNELIEASHISPTSIRINSHEDSEAKALARLFKVYCPDLLTVPKEEISEKTLTISSYFEDLDSELDPELIDPYLRDLQDYFSGLFLSQSNEEREDLCSDACSKICSDIERKLRRYLFPYFNSELEDENIHEAICSLMVGFKRSDNRKPNIRMLTLPELLHVYSHHFENKGIKLGLPEKKQIPSLVEIRNKSVHGSLEVNMKNWKNVTNKLLELIVNSRKILTFLHT